MDEDENELLVGGAMNLFGDVGDVWGDGSGFTVAQVARALVAHGDGPLTVHLNSAGGIATDGVAIYSLLKARGNVTVLIDGLAASAASVIAMAGDRIEIRDGAMFMIHEASILAIGNAEALKKKSEQLDKMSAEYAGIYARRTGLPADKIRTMMRAETWFTADEAVQLGFANTKIAEAAARAHAFAYRSYAHAPEPLLALHRPLPTFAAPTAQLETPPMEPTEAEKAAAEKARFETAVAKAAADLAAKAEADAKAKAEAEAAARNAPKAWAHQFYALANRSKLDIATATDIVETSTSLDMAKDSLIEALAKADVETKPGGQRSAHVTADAQDKFRAGTTQAMLARLGVEARDPKNEFNGIGPMALARECAAIAGIRTRDPRQMVAQLITQGTSDFPNIVANIAEKSMIKGYGEANETFDQWTSEGSVPDFKQALRINLNPLGSLPVLPEGAEYKYAGTSDMGEYYSAVTYGQKFSITRQAIINDDMDAFGRIPRKFGVAAKRTIGDQVVNAITANPVTTGGEITAIGAVMGDGNPLYCAAHSNLQNGAGSSLSATSLQVARLAMVQQKARNSAALVAQGKPPVQLGIRPKHLLVPSALLLSGRQILKSTAQIGQANPGVKNPVENLVESLIEEWRLDLVSETGWYLLADQTLEETVEVFYLNGEKNPFMEAEPGWNVDGMEWKIRIDFGVKAFLWETSQYSAGQ